MRRTIFLVLKGLAMGTADIIPGVSGGTVAFITGIYEELINSIKAVDLEALRHLLKGNFNAFWTQINGAFLLPLLSGIAIAIISLIPVMKYLFDHYEIYVWSFFFGLITISSYLIAKTIQKRSNVMVILALLVGICLGFYVTILTKTTTPNDYWFIFLTGSLAICAMILPGISGSFLLLIMGKYIFIINALKALKFDIIGTFAVGCIFGLLFFSRIISFFFERYRDLTISLMAGFMIGSLNKVWPLKQTIETYRDQHGIEKPLIQHNLWITDWLQMSNTHTMTMLYWAFFYMLIGFGLVFFIEKWSSQIKTT